MFINDMSLKYRLFQARRLLEAFQIDPKRIKKAISALPWYLQSLKKFRTQTSWPIFFEPQLLDRYEESGGHGEYFWQDLWVAKKIIEAAPERHVDVGSRLDGFIAHLACVRDIDVLDIRPTDVTVSRVHFHQVDIFSLPKKWEGVADSVTCLHTIEHFGLGRYGDPINAEGWRQGLKSLKKILKPGGTLWISTPIGQERVCFNAHRIFNPQTIVDAARELGLKLQVFSFLTRDKLSAGDFVTSNNIPNDMAMMSKQRYGVGIFQFQLL